MAAGRECARSASSCGRSATQVAANAVTVVEAPASVAADALVQAASIHGLALVAGRGALAGKVVRIDHMGAGASPEAVLGSLIALGESLRDHGLHVDIAGAVGVAGEALL